MYLWPSVPPNDFPSSIASLNTVLFALATFVLIYQPDFIDDQTQIIWLRITIMGTILGLIGLRIIKRRRKRLGL